MSLRSMLATGLASQYVADHVMLSPDGTGVTSLANLLGTMTGTVDGTIADVGAVTVAISSAGGNTYADSTVNTAVNTAVNLAVTSVNLQLKELQTAVNRALTYLRTGAQDQG